MTADTTIRIDGVGYRRDGRTILEHVTAVIPPGITAVTGPSGSGKSTLLALVAGLDTPDTGTVHNPYPPAQTGLVLQAYGLVGLLTAAENIEIALQAHPGSTRSKIRARAAAALDDVHLTASADHLVETLSGGQQQRVAIARALATRPRLLIADETTAALDHDTADHITGLISRVAQQGGTVLLATHDRALASRADHQIDLQPT
ncbi:ABC transporter ATP-binding protein [Amnibacterium endophyticum]|uniref:ABC transporter ATP-binding protein n=1 Tax=Amnibacterium endophyticum TaxID=2109337 RepID=A0ABW4LGF5_9MICO